MPEADRPGVVAHGAQPEGQLAQRPAAGQRLQRRRQHEQRQDDGEQHRGRGEGLVRAGGRDYGDSAGRARAGAGWRPRRSHPRPRGRRRRQQGARARRPRRSPGRRRRRRPCCCSWLASLPAGLRRDGSSASSPGPAAGRSTRVSPWIWTRTSPHTGRSGDGWTSWCASAAWTVRRPTRSSTSTSGWPPTCPSCGRRAPDPSLVTYLSSLLARARARSAGVRTTSWSRHPALLHRDLPRGAVPHPPLVAGDPLANVVVAFVAGLVVRRAPAGRDRLALPGRDRPARQHRLRGLLQRVRRLPSSPLRVWTNNAWVAALCIAFGVLGLPVIYLLFQNMLNVALIGALMVGHGRGCPVLRPDPAARDARADSGVRRRRRGAAAVLVVGRARARAPGPGHRRTRGARRWPSRSGWSSCCSVSGVIEAFVTPSSLPTWARIGDRRRGRARLSSPTCSPSAGGRTGVA